MTGRHKVLISVLEYSLLSTWGTHTICFVLCRINHSQHNQGGKKSVNHLDQPPHCLQARIEPCFQMLGSSHGLSGPIGCWFLQENKNKQLKKREAGLHGSFSSVGFKTWWNFCLSPEYPLTFLLFEAISSPCHSLCWRMCKIVAQDVCVYVLKPE